MFKEQQPSRSYGFDAIHSELTNSFPDIFNHVTINRSLNNKFLVPKAQPDTECDLIFSSQWGFIERRPGLHSHSPKVPVSCLDYLFLFKLVEDEKKIGLEALLKQPLLFTEYSEDNEPFERNYTLSLIGPDEKYRIEEYYEIFKQDQLRQLGLKTGKVIAISDRQSVKSTKRRSVAAKPLVYFSAYKDKREDNPSRLLEDLKKYSNWYKSIPLNYPHSYHLIKDGEGKDVYILKETGNFVYKDGYMKYPASVEYHGIIVTPTGIIRPDPQTKNQLWQPENLPLYRFFRTDVGYNISHLKSGKWENIASLYYVADPFKNGYFEMALISAESQNKPSN